MNIIIMMALLGFSEKVGEFKAIPSHDSWSSRVKPVKPPGPGGLPLLRGTEARTRRRRSARRRGAATATERLEVTSAVCLDRLADHEQVARFGIIFRKRRGRQPAARSSGFADRPIKLIGSADDLIWNVKVFWKSHRNCRIVKLKTS